MTFSTFAIVWLIGAFHFSKFLLSGNRVTLKVYLEFPKYGTYFFYVFHFMKLKRLEWMGFKLLALTLTRFEKALIFL